MMFVVKMRICMNVPYYNEGIFIQNQKVFSPYLFVFNEAWRMRKCSNANLFRALHPCKPAPGSFLLARISFLYRGWLPFLQNSDVVEVNWKRYKPRYHIQIHSHLINHVKFSVPVLFSEVCNLLILGTLA